MVPAAASNVGNRCRLHVHGFKDLQSVAPEIQLHPSELQLPPKAFHPGLPHHRDHRTERGHLVHPAIIDGFDEPGVWIVISQQPPLPYDDFRPLPCSLPTRRR